MPPRTISAMNAGGVEHDAEEHGGEALGQVEPRRARVGKFPCFSMSGIADVEWRVVEDAAAAVAELVGEDVEEVTARVDDPARHAGPEEQEHQAGDHRPARRRRSRNQSSSVSFARPAGCRRRHRRSA